MHSLRRTAATAAVLVPTLAMLAAAEPNGTIVIKAPEDAAAPTNLPLAAIEHEVALTPGGVTLLDGDEFRQRQVANLADALRFVPGYLAQSSTGSSGIALSARGSNLDSKSYDTNGVRMLEDGLPITTADGNNHNRFISPLVARHAVVARGANSLEYGGSTLGGTINFITPTAYDSAPLGGFVSGGSHGYLNGFASASRVFGDGFDAQATLEGRTRDGYRDHSEEDQVAVYANAGYRFNDAVSTRLYASWYDQDQELPGTLSQAQIDQDPDQAAAGAEAGRLGLDLDAWRIADKTSVRLGEDERLDLGLSFEHQEIFHPIVAANQFFGGLLIERESDDIWATARYGATWAARHEVVFGANYGHSRVDQILSGNAGGSPGALIETADMSAQTIEFYASDRWRLDDRWVLVGGVQTVFASRAIDASDDTGAPAASPDEDYIGVSPRLGVIWRFARGAEAFASVSRLFEAPTLFELDDAGDDNDQALDAMTGTSIEIGGRGRGRLGAGGTWDWEATFYYALIADEILTVEDPPGSGINVSGNVDRTIHAGIELAAGAALPIAGNGRHRLAPRLALSLNHFVFDDDPAFGNNDLPGAPKAVLRSELLWRHGSGWFAGPTCDVVGPQYADFANTFEVDGYVLLGLRGGYQADRWSAFVEVRNLLDEEYAYPSGAAAVAAADDAVLYPGEPLSVYAGVEVAF